MSWYASDGKRSAVLARAVAREYGVASVPENELERLAAEFGSLIPEAMRPGKVDDLDAEYSHAMRMYGHLLNRQHFAYVSSPAHVFAPPTSPAPRVQQAKPGDGSVSETIRKFKQPLNDPRWYRSKRQGGLR